MKKKDPPIDGLSPKDLVKLRAAIRQVWAWSTPRRLCIKRATGADGFTYCEQCNKRSPKIFVDHITPAGDLLSEGYFQRMFIPSIKLQALCKECHNAKTKGERIGRSKSKVRVLQG